MRLTMEVARTGDYVLLKLDHGENILESIEEVIDGEKTSLLVVMGIGMITDFELGYFDRDKRKYVTKVFDEPHELTMMQGSVAREGNPRMHIHTVVADKEHHTSGGHLLKGFAWMSNEIGFLRLKGVDTRRWMDKDKGVSVLHVSQVTE